MTQKEFLNFKKSEKLKQSYIEDHQSVMHVATIAFLPFFSAQSETIEVYSVKRRLETVFSGTMPNLFNWPS